MYGSTNSGYQAVETDPEAAISRPLPVASSTSIQEQESAAAVDPSLPIKDQLYARQYDVAVGKWLGQGWRLFKACWKSLLLFSIVFLILEILRIVVDNHWGPAAEVFDTIFWLCQFFLAAGGYLAPFAAMRAGGQDEHAIAANWNWKLLYTGFFWFWVAILMAVFYWIFVLLGFILLILPGLYLMLSLSFAFPIYIEFKSAGLSFFDAYRVSNHQVWKHVFGILWLWIVAILLVIAGFFCFGVGLLVAVPVTMMMVAFAFRDIFGLNTARPDEDTLIVCCY
eukprot:TRINITY_DN23456_c0_g1_i1.p1 TRINITY_DN23456_c0_g1~~TRINITY_DN23456_c0_g1_i1.p1  ORF type:complete len:281 (+),score=66.21 TRINITY_DN23456_c0_g1_i1:50-892(+)